MTYSSKITTKGQVTIPVQLRRRLNIKSGQRITFALNKKGNAEIMQQVDVHELRRQTQVHLNKMGFTPEKLHKMAENYRNGDGITLHVKEKYGRPS